MKEGIKRKNKKAIKRKTNRKKIKRKKKKRKNFCFSFFHFVSFSKEERNRTKKEWDRKSVMWMKRKERGGGEQREKE